MGVTLTTSQKQMLGQQAPDMLQWNFINITEYSKLYHHKAKPSIIIEEFPINIFNQAQINHQYAIYKLRKHHSFLVSSYYLSIILYDNTCSTSKQMKVYLQHIPKRLYQINCKFKFPQLLHFYHQVLIGYYFLVTHPLINHFFQVNDKMIGINGNGIIKIWMSSYFQKSRQIIEQVDYKGITTQQKMVKCIISILRRYTEFGPYQKQNEIDQNFGLFDQRKSLKFSQAIQIIRNLANRYNRGIIPNYISQYYYTTIGFQQKPSYSKLKQKIINTKGSSLRNSKVFKVSPSQTLYGIHNNQIEKKTLTKSYNSSLQSLQNANYSNKIHYNQIGKNKLSNQRIKTENNTIIYVRSQSQPLLINYQPIKFHNLPSTTQINFYPNLTQNNTNQVQMFIPIKAESPYFGGIYRNRYQNFNNNPQNQYNRKLFHSQNSHSIGQNLNKKSKSVNKIQKHTPEQLKMIKQQSQMQKNPFSLTDSYQFSPQNQNQKLLWDLTFQDDKIQELNSSTKDFYTKLFTNDTQYLDKVQNKEESSQFTFLKGGNKIQQGQKSKKNQTDFNNPIIFEDKNIKSTRVSPIYKKFQSNQKYESNNRLDRNINYNFQKGINSNNLIPRVGQNFKRQCDRFWNTAKSMNNSQRLQFPIDSQNKNFYQHQFHHKHLIFQNQARYINQNAHSNYNQIHIPMNRFNSNKKDVRYRIITSNNNKIFKNENFQQERNINKEDNNKRYKFY